MNVDFGQGWKYVSNPITVTLRQPDGSEQAVDHVAERAATLQDVQQEPAILEEETKVFHLWADWLAGTVPVKGSKVVKADGSVWHVARRETMSHGRRFRLTTFKERGP